MKVASDTVAVLLMAYGTPGTEDEVEPYLTDIFGGRKPTQEQIHSLKTRYEKIGGSSPLLEITQSQADALGKKMSEVSDETGYKVYLGMKHAKPFIGETVKRISEDGIRKIIALPLTPHYSKLSVGTYFDAVKKGVEGINTPMEVAYVNQWHDQPLFLKAVTEKIKDAILKFPESVRSDIAVMFTAHSLPERILEWNDPYPGQLNETCELIAEMIKLKNWNLAYQSAGKRGGKWLGPDIFKTLAGLAESGFINVLIVPIGFVSDNLEIKYDIDIECMEFASSKSINLRRTESLNVSPTFIEALTAIVREHS